MVVFNLYRDQAVFKIASAAVLMDNGAIVTVQRGKGQKEMTHVTVCKSEANFLATTGR